MSLQHVSFGMSVLHVSIGMSLHHVSFGMSVLHVSIGMCLLPVNISMSLLHVMLVFISVFIYCCIWKRDQTRKGGRERQRASQRERVVRKREGDTYMYYSDCVFIN